MRIRIICTVIVLSAFAEACVAQRAPAAPLSGSFGNDISVSYVLAVKDSNLDLGNGGEVTSTHYLSRRLGLTAEAAVFKMGLYKEREGAVRFGPTYRFNTGADFQPFVHALVGYSVVSATYLGHHRWGGTVLLGGGAEVRLKGALFARVTTDFADDWDAKTRFGRGSVGFAYHFGDSSERR